MVKDNDLKNSGLIADQASLSGLNASPEFDGNVQRLFDITMLRPAVEFPFSIRPLTKHLSAIGHGWYLLTGPRPSVVDALPKETIRACMILWARNTSSAVLVTRCEDSFDGEDCEDNEIPSIEYFMPTSTKWAYNEVLRAGSAKFMESATYGSSGQFLFKVVRLNNSHLYYPSRVRNACETPIAISLTGTSK